MRILRFFGTNVDDQFVTIKQQIEEFLRGAISNTSYSKRLLESWFTTFMVNASDKPDNDKSIEGLTKRQIIFPIIAVVIDPPIIEAEFNKVCDYENHDEITQEFRRIISEAAFDYQFITDVLADYREKKKMVSSIEPYKYEFTRNNWRNYEKSFTRIANDKKREAVIKIILLTTISHMTTIQQIKEAAGL